MNILEIYRVSKKILKLYEELDHYDWEIHCNDELHPSDELKYDKIKAKIAKLEKKLKNHLQSR